jgi:tryptophanyl-tRNA synthetase
MSKSLGNVILMTDEPDRIQAVVRTAITDPQKIRRGDPGRPEICNVFAWHETFNGAERDRIAAQCRAGTLGCVPCKAEAAAAIGDRFADFRDRRNTLARDPQAVIEIIRTGSRRARDFARGTMAMVRRAMNLFRLED